MRRLCERREADAWRSHIMPMLWLVLVCLMLATMVGAGWADHPVLPLSANQSDLEWYRNNVAGVMALSEADMLKVIPEKSGIYFTDCPNCTGGLQEGQFAEHSGQAYQPWDLSHPEVMRCTYCGQEYPSAKYPMKDVLKVHNPRGEVQEYPYWADEKGYRHYFGARIDYHRIRFMEAMARSLARAYALSQDPQYARRCALILDRFAEVFPGYCYHFDYPFQEKVIYDGQVDPKDFRAGFRTARWTWWAYLDIPDVLLEAYDLIYPSGELEKLSAEKGHDVKAEVEGLFLNAVQQVLANRDDLSNMSPGTWADIIRAGRVLQRPEWVHEAMGRLGRFMETEFLNDGAWSESAPSYNSQVIGSLAAVFTAAAGYSDPPGYQDPATGQRFDNLDVRGQTPAVVRAQHAFDLMRLPNGRLIPLHDTWSANSRAALEQSRPFLLPAMGLGCLAGGEKQGQWQAALTWSPGGGHEHWDGLSLILFSQEHELLSDLGYTHSRDRAWTLPTAAHNTVVIDQKNQTADKGTLGGLRYFSAMPDCQVVSVDNPQVYPGLAQVYRRTLIALAPAGGVGGCLVDLFEVQGGQQHDYFLHGCADAPGTLRTTSGDQELATEPLDTLLPAGFEFAEARNEGECGLTLEGPHAYGYLRDLRRVVGEMPREATLDFALTDPEVRLRAHLLLEPGDQLVTGRNPAVRGAKENDDNLRNFWRPFALLRRTGGRSVFAAVLEPLAGNGGPATARRLDLPEAELALEVVNGPQTALVLLRPRALEAEWGGERVQATAELAVIWTGPGAGGMVVGGALSWGNHSLAAIPVGDRALLAVDRAAQAITVQGELLPAAGTVITLDHAGRRTSAYTVAKSERQGEDSRITVVEDPGFDWDAATQTATFKTWPGTTYQGPHVVRLTPTACFHVQDAN
jgi:hypothetical protein